MVWRRETTFPGGSWSWWRFIENAADGGAQGPEGAFVLQNGTSTGADIRPTVWTTHTWWGEDGSFVVNGDVSFNAATIQDLTAVVTATLPGGTQVAGDLIATGSVLADNVQVLSYYSGDIVIDPIAAGDYKQFTQVLPGGFTNPAKMAVTVTGIGVSRGVRFGITSVEDITTSAIDIAVVGSSQMGGATTWVGRIEVVEYP